MEKVLWLKNVPTQWSGSALDKIFCFQTWGKMLLGWLKGSCYVPMRKGGLERWNTLWKVDSSLERWEQGQWPTDGPCQPESGTEIKTAQIWVLTKTEINSLIFTSPKQLTTLAVSSFLRKRLICTLIFSIAVVEKGSFLFSLFTLPTCSVCCLKKARVSLWGKPPRKRCSLTMSHVHSTQGLFADFLPVILTSIWGSRMSVRRSISGESFFAPKLLCVPPSSSFPCELGGGTTWKWWMEQP